MPPEVFQHFLDGVVRPVLAQLLHTPLQELGKQPALWEGCHCQRDACLSCWVERNFWQAQEKKQA